MRGGARKGAGRKALPEDEKLKKVNISLLPDTIGKLKQQAEDKKMTFRAYVRGMLESISKEGRVKL